MKTDEKGILTVPVLGKTDPLVRGYLGVWVPAEDHNNGKKLGKGIDGINAFADPTEAADNTGTGTADKGRNGHEWQKAEMRQMQHWMIRKQE